MKAEQDGRNASNVLRRRTMPVRSSAPRLAGFSVRTLVHAIVPEQEYALAAEWNSVCIDRHSRQRVTKESKPFIGNDTFYVT